MPRTATRPAAIRVPDANLEISRFTLGNGLRVVLSPDRSAPVVGVCVVYDVGFRSEPEGRTGFAHLFEHLMFQGSENVGKMEHARLVEGAGGVMNGSTHPDFTNYYEALPSGALELALWLEADRMRAPRLTQENLDNQISVVQEEIRVNVMNQPYGGFPWISLPPVAFDTFANAHNGYGDFAELESASLDDARDFFSRYYAPGNAVLAVAGDLDVAATTEMVERLFGGIKARKVPKLPNFGEPVPTKERRGVIHDALAPQPALAIGWRVPDPIRELDDYLASVLLAEVLTDGDASRLQRRLVLDDRIVTGVSGYLGAFGDPFEVRDPVLLTLEVHHPDSTKAGKVLDVVQEELARIRTEGIDADELQRVQARVAAQLLRGTDSLVGRTNHLAVVEAQRGAAELVGRLPSMLAEVEADAVVAAAARCTEDSRSVLEVRPGKAA
ncbi:MAG TPA: pitrilysin family protein [Mycobacteriales bacterium]|nr:pitrilysin family protein [Mycobacteriales bacterium]